MRGVDPYYTWTAAAMGLSLVVVFVGFGLLYRYGGVLLPPASPPPLAIFVLERDSPERAVAVQGHAFEWIAAPADRCVSIIRKEPSLAQPAVLVTRVAALVCGVRAVQRFGDVDGE